MTITRRQKRTARKLVLPLIALGMMTAMMAMHSGSSPRPANTNTSNALYAR
jgi:hypothetical protein